MRRLTANTLPHSTACAIQLSSALYNANRHIRTTTHNNGEYFNIKKDFPNLYKLRNHILFSLDDKKRTLPVRLLMSITCSAIFFSLMDLLFSGNNLKEIKWSLKHSEKDLKRCADSLEKLSNQAEKMNEPVSMSKKP